MKAQIHSGKIQIQRKAHSFSQTFPISPSIQTTLLKLQLWEGKHVFIARRGSTAEQLVVQHGRQLYLTPL